MSSLIDKSGNLVYFGQLSWANFVDWLITLTLSAVLCVTAIALGGVRPESQIVILPGVCLLLALHGVWCLVSKETPTRMSQVPLVFAPLLFWALFKVGQSPAPWRGEQQLIYILEAFVFFAVFASNARARVHVWVVLLAGLIPLGLGVFNAFYQFFQDPKRIVDSLTEYTVELSPDFLGRATGTFADPESFVVLLLLLGPCILFVGIVPRLPMIIRVMCCYVAVMLYLALLMAQVLWALPVLVVSTLALAWLSSRKFLERVKRVAVGLLLLITLSLGLEYSHNTLRHSALSAMDEGGEVIRQELWREALILAAEDHYFGAGVGSSALRLEQSPRLAMAQAPASPLNDYLLVLLELGIPGLVLLLVPLCVLAFFVYRRWRSEPYRVRMSGHKETIMPPQCFFISIAILGCLSSLLCLLFTSVVEQPALLFYVAMFWGLLVKCCFNRRLKLPSSLPLRAVCCVLWIVLAFALYTGGSVRLKAQAVELEARQRLEHLIDARVHLSGNDDWLDEVIAMYEGATELHPGNADLWIGLSASYNQLFFRNPSAFREVGQLAVDAADEAISISDAYWRSWAQLGISHALSGDADSAERAFLRALERAPNSSNAHYYWASFLSHYPARIGEAMRAVDQAIEINPDNSAAIRLQQKLLIL